MIQSPRRSVTRFFIPLIDVLLLLFVIFLLMPISGQEELQERRDEAADLGDRVDILERELDSKVKDLQRYDSLKPALIDVEKLQEEVDRLRRQLKQTLQKTVVHVIDADGRTGNISYWDASLPIDKARVEIPDQKTAAAMIERHKKEAEGREIYYYFLMPRPVTTLPSLGQIRAYQRWFAAIPNSLNKETMP